MYGLHLVIAHQHTKQIPGAATAVSDEQLRCESSVPSRGRGHQEALCDGRFVRGLPREGSDRADHREGCSQADSEARRAAATASGRANGLHQARVAEGRRIHHGIRTPASPRSRDLRGLLNPVLKYIEPVKPLEFYTLYTLRVSGSLAIADLATRLGARREDIEEAVNTLAGRGYIEVYREGNKKIRLGGVLLFSLVLDMVLWPWFLLGLPVAFPLCVVLALLILVFLSLVFTSALFKWIILPVAEGFSAWLLWRCLPRLGWSPT